MEYECNELHAIEVVLLPGGGVGKKIKSIKTDSQFIICLAFRFLPEDNAKMFSST